MIKKSSQLALLLLYNFSNDRQYYQFDKVTELLDACQITSQRSLWHLLEKNGLVSIDYTTNYKQISITAAGKAELLKIFPALLPDWAAWDGKWYSIAFLQAPRGDRNFRYLRSFLILKKSVLLARGVYIFPSLLLPHIQAEVERAYTRSVVLFSLGEVIAGQFEQFVLDAYNVKDTKINYSRVSIQLSQLLIKNDHKNISINRQKSTIGNLINSLYSVIDDDIGFIQHYFPHSQAAREILPAVQHALLLEENVTRRNTSTV